MGRIGMSVCCRQRADRCGAFRLGQHEAVGLAGKDRGQIGLGQPAGQRVDADEQAHRAVGSGEDIRHRRARVGLSAWRNRILQIEDQGIGADA
jgi:hypothetical protein